MEGSPLELHCIAICCQHPCGRAPRDRDPYYCPRNCLTQPDADVLASGPRPRGGDDEVIDVELLVRWAPRNPTVERQLQGIQPQDRAVPEAEPRPRAALHAVKPERLAGVRLATRVELHRELHMVPHPPAQSQRWFVGFGPIAVPPPARHDVRVP